MSEEREMSKLKLPLDVFLIYKHGGHPKPKKHFYKETFEKRHQARNFCRNRSWVEGLTIVHPDGTEESYT